uniref:PilN domain-containing protein n=1 Tax=Pontiella sp. TaxID=2837462 RepID=UPI0035645648
SGFAVCMGLACSPAVAIDLIPPSLSRARNVQQRQPLWFACIGLLIVLLAVWVVNLDARIRHTASALEQTEQQAEMLEQWEEQLVPIEKRIEALNRQAGLYARLLNERYRWADVLNELNAVLPDGMFLLNSEPIRPMDRVAGIRIAVLSYLDKEAEDADAVKQLRDALRASPLFSAQTKVFSRPSKKEFAREFVLDVYFAEEQP